MSDATVVLLANDSFASYMNAIPGAQMDPDTGLIEIPVSSVALMEPLKFVIGDSVLVMDVAAQLVPQDENLVWGGVAGKQYGVVGEYDKLKGGLDFILGQKFMERYYAVGGGFAVRASRADYHLTGIRCGCQQNRICFHVSIDS